jgi:hypothetical protein
MVKATYSKSTGTVSLHFDRGENDTITGWFAQILDEYDGLDDATIQDMCNVINALDNAEEVA